MSSKRKYLIKVTTIHEVEIDTDAPIVNAYKDLKELAHDLASYNFDVLPVIGQGVTIIDDTIDEIEIGFK